MIIVENTIKLFKEEFYRLLQLYLTQEVNF